LYVTFDTPHARRRVERGENEGDERDRRDGVVLTAGWVTDPQPYREERSGW
jgi:hypothetical protein